MQTSSRIVFLAHQKQYLGQLLPRDRCPRHGVLRLEAQQSLPRRHRPLECEFGVAGFVDGAGFRAGAVGRKHGARLEHGAVEDFAVDDLCLVRPDRVGAVHVHDAGDLRQDLVHVVRIAAAAQVLAGLGEVFAARQGGRRPDLRAPAEARKRPSWGERVGAARGGGGMVGQLFPQHLVLLHVRRSRFARGLVRIDPHDRGLVVRPAPDGVEAIVGNEGVSDAADRVRHRVALQGNVAVPSVPKRPEGDVDWNVVPKPVGAV